MSDKAAAQMVDAELAAVPEDEPELDLLAEPVTIEGQWKQAIQRRAGRPPGAKNKRNERTLSWLRSKYVDPRERMLAVLTMNTADLAALLHCSMFEAQQEQRLCAAVVLPYVAQKQPLSVNLETRTAVHLHVSLDGISVASEGAVNITPRVLDIEEIQELTDEDKPDV